MHINPIGIDPLDNELLRRKKVQLDILRLDEIHPVVSGNKWFKLQYYLIDATEKGYDSLLTFGGAYSNHIVATAYAARQHGFKATGIIRGEAPKIWSPTLLEATALGMELIFLPRKIFGTLKRNDFPEELEQRFGKHYIIPEGGYGKPGVRGAQEIMDTIKPRYYTHFVAAVGTGTTLTGILQSSKNDQQVVGISAMKNNHGLEAEIRHLYEKPLPERFYLFHDYHFDGFAKYNEALISFINTFYLNSSVPLDFVYTAKMMYGALDLVKKGFFPAGSSILTIHSGGLQGNRSLKEGLLRF